LYIVTGYIMTIGDIMKKLVSFLIVGIFICLYITAAYASNESRDIAPKGTNYVLVTEYQDSSFPKYSELGGIGNDVNLALNKSLNHRSISIKSVSVVPYRPLKRILLDLKYGRISFFALLAYTSARSRQFEYSDIPVYITSSVFVKRKEDAFVYTGPSSLEGKKIGVVAGTRTQRFLKSLIGGVIHAKIYEVSDVTSLLRMVARGRLDLGFYSALSLKYLVTSLYNKELVLAPGIVDRYGHYLVYSRNVPKDVVFHVNDALFHLVSEGLLDNILSHYGVKPETVSLRDFYVGIPQYLCGEKGEVFRILTSYNLNPHIACYSQSFLDMYLKNGVIFSVWSDTPITDSYILVKGRYFSCSPAIRGVCSFLQKVIYDEGTR